jgi:hypothetical protein
LARLSVKSLRRRSRDAGLQSESAAVHHHVHHRHWSGTQGWRIREFQVHGAGYML